MIDDKELEDIFGIPQDGSNISEDSHDSAYIDVCSNKNNLSFSDEINKLNRDMEAKNVKQEKVTKIDLSIQNKSKEQNENEKNNNVRSRDNKTELTESDEFLGDKVLHSKDKEDLDASGEKARDIKFIFSKNKEKKEEWKLNCQDSIFEKFYIAKMESLSDWLLVGGRINFEKVNQELIDSRIDLSNVNFADFNMLFNLLKNVQIFKDRITLIEIQCNNQYFCWKRAIDLFQGILAQCHYEKPAAKQDGIVYEHMSDFISYYSRLESLHYNIQSVVKNLDQAFDTISRQITISMPSRDYESVENKMNSNSVVGESFINNEKKSSLNLSKNKTVDTVKTGTVDWTDFN